MEILIYDKHMTRLGALGGAAEVVFSPIANGVGEAKVRISPSRPRVAQAMEPGARLLIDVPGVIRFSGPVVAVNGTGPAEASIELTVRDDSRILWDWLAWPAPGKPISAQGQAYAKYTGTAEKILKAVVNANRGRFPEPVECAPDLGRGATIPGGVQFRWHPIADRLLTAFEQAGLVLSVVQDGPRIMVDTREQHAIPKPLSVASGNLTHWSWNNSAPTATRIVGGGQGKGDLRTALQKIDTTLETQYGFATERFVDARDTDEPNEITGRLDEALAEGAPKFGLDATIMQSKSFQYGTHYRVGDLISIDTGSLQIADILRSTSFSWTRELGLEIAPEIGERSDDPDLVLAKQVRALQKGVTDLKVSQ